MKKCDLGDLGAPRRSKVLKTQLCDSDPSEHQKTPYTYAKMRKRFFVFFSFLENYEIPSLFSKAFREGKLQAEVHTFSSKTLQVAKVAPLELFSLQNDTSITFIDVSDVFWCSESPKTRLGAQNAFWSNFSSLGPRKRARGRCCIRVKAVLARLANFELQRAPWEHLGHFGS